MDLTRNLIKKRFRPIWMFLAMVNILQIPFQAKSQVTAVFEGNYSTVRQDNILQNIEPIFGGGAGLSITYFPFKNFPNLSFSNEVVNILRGYAQNLDRRYEMKFDYMTLPILVNYRFIPNFSAHAGVEPSFLFGTNIEQGFETYNHFDFAVVVGLSFFESNKCSFFTRCTYGLLPMLDYYRFDKLGNFNGEIHDIKNLCFTIGLKIDLKHEEIHLYH